MKYHSKIYHKFIFTHQFFRFLLLDRILNKKDNLILVTGKRGAGKTTVALKQIMGFSDIISNEQYYNKQKNIHLKEEEKIKYVLKDFTKFDMERHMCFGKKELENLWKEERKAFILADEIIVSASRRKSMTKGNKLIHEIATINRKNYNTIFLLLPSIEDLDLAILQYITHWVHVSQQGLAAVLLPNPPTLFGRGSWDIDQMKKIYEKFIEKNPTAQAVPYWLFNNFRGYIKFSAMTAGVERQYDEISHRKKNQNSNGVDEEETVKVRKDAMPEEKQSKIKNIVQNLIDGKITDSEEYYRASIGLELSKEKFNKEINKVLFSNGDGRTFTKIIKDNRNYSIAKEEEKIDLGEKI